MCTLSHGVRPAASRLYRRPHPRPCEDSGRIGGRIPSERTRGLARNVELKVRCDAETLSFVERRLAQLGHDCLDLHQVDTYFGATRGRLKVRELHSVAGNTVELIAYARPDELGMRLSDYQRIVFPRAERASLRTVLAAALDELVVVDKRRKVAVVGRTRVHLDRVTGLGCFVELETVLAEGDDEGEGRAELARVVDILSIGDLTPVAASYSDLMLEPVWSRPGSDADR